MNHKPATPLPWYRAAADRHVQLTPESSGPWLRTAHVEGSTRDEWARIESNQRDVAYIVHAANAYPRLVETIKGWLPRDVSEDGTQDQAMRALLRELGESE